MKRFIILLAISLVMGNLACKKKQKTEESEEKITIDMSSEEVTKSDLVNEEKSGDCDDFIDEYEEWMENYVALLGKHKDNPTALVSSPEYTSMTMDMINWSSRWRELAIDCATDPDYERRFNEIQEKADKEMEALGIK